MRLVIALGGNALLQRGEPFDINTQRRNIARACAAIAPLAAYNQLILTHGNGPQVGMLALQAAAGDPTDRTPLDVLGAQSDGMIGYLLEQQLRNHIPHCEVANIITQTVVDARDPAFTTPTKFVGPVYPAQSDVAQHNPEWHFALDGESLRRVVPSPQPREILELSAIDQLSQAGHIVICTGGGGVPVVRDITGGREQFCGVDAVIDKDLASALLAQQLGAGGLLLLTDVPAVYRNWGARPTEPIHKIGVAELRHMEFAAGSMGPKVEAACRFANNTGRRVGIGALADAEDILHERAGTIIYRQLPRSQPQETR